jgi:hypothetical protein
MQPTLSPRPYVEAARWSHLLLDGCAGWEQVVGSET